MTFKKKEMKTGAPDQLSRSTEVSGTRLCANSEEAQAISSFYSSPGGQFKQARGPQTQTRGWAVSPRHPALTQWVRMMESREGRSPNEGQMGSQGIHGAAGHLDTATYPRPNLWFPPGLTRFISKLS